MKTLELARSATSLYKRGQYVTLSSVVLLALLCSQVVSKGSSTNLLNLWLVYSIAALGFYWIFALGGRFAFSQTFMMALGGYTTAFFDRHGVGFLGCVLAALVVTAVSALVVGTVLWRTEHFYFALGTLAVTEIGVVLFGKTSSFTGTNGNITGISYPIFFGHELRTDGEVFWLLAAVLAALLLLTIWISRSPVARDLTAVRDMPTVSKTLGVSVDALRMTTFVTGSAVGGLAGALITHWQGFIGVDSFGLNLGIGLFLMVILGGLASHWGALVGAAFYVAVPELLSGLQQYMSILYGALLLVIILIFPSGLIGLADTMTQWRRKDHPGSAAS
ncbi:branched-chain amino acid ABC transporter permease [Rhodococcus sp. T2V]|uniref:branched-chain amino acid ABC transporter permease n=1 Tax=Rhodococcus sp. T2V TaxID=3034164 RepID=UPI0023E2EBC7|nr:branched-chain amino acid ABC transporter permease [Rhodococcus sp. T2V]MDF3313148.1 branched-chain amino acid ABC transporter permease [Rhodococcus sp. T2V]